MQQNAMRRPHRALCGPPVDGLMRRLEKLGRLLTVEEWWMVCRQLPAGPALAEETRLVAVARAELDRFLARH